MIMINLSLNELKLIAKSGSIKDYKKIKIKILSEPKPNINLSQKKLKKIRKDFSKLRHSFVN